MDNNDTKPQSIPVTVTDDNDVSTEAIKDLNVDEHGAMQDQDMSTEPTNQVTPPEAMMDVSPPPQDEVIAEPKPLSAPEPTPEPEQANLDMPAAPPLTPTEQVFSPDGSNSAHAAFSEAPKKTGKGLVMGIAVVLALVLAAIAVLVYLKATSSTKSTANNKPDTTVKAVSVTASDVDAASKDVDDTLNTLSDADFTADVISDKALGLQ